MYPPWLHRPLGLDRAGLPLAIQVVGPKYSEQTLIAFARLIEPLHDGYVPLSTSLAAGSGSTPP